MKKALTTLSKAMELDPKNVLCKFHKAILLFNVGQYQVIVIFYLPDFVNQNKQAERRYSQVG